MGGADLGYPGVIETWANASGIRPAMPKGELPMGGYTETVRWGDIAELAASMPAAGTK